MIIQGNNLVVNGSSVDGTKLTNHDKITVDSVGSTLYPNTSTLKLGDADTLDRTGANGVNRLRMTIAPPSHTGNEWDFVTHDDTSSAYLQIGYGLMSGNSPSMTNTALKIRHDGIIDTPKQPGCMIACQSADINWTAGNIIQYGTNSGGNSQKLWDTTGSYDMANSRYNAPVAGKYYLSFTCNGVSTSSTRMRAYPRINGSMIGNSLHARGCSSIGGDLDQRTFAGIISLNANDYVDVYMGEGTADTFGANYFCIMKVM